MFLFTWNGLTAGACELNRLFNSNLRILSSDIMDNINISKAKTDDFPEIFVLLQQLWPDKKLDKERLKEAFDQGLENQFQEYLIAKYDGRTIGFVTLTIRSSLWQEGNLAHVDELIVDQEFRGEGVGTKLLNEITKLAKEKSCKKIELDSAFHRKESHSFYESLGFENRAFLFSKTL